MSTEYVLIKRGLYYAPNCQGYTGVLAEAGRYTEDQARPRVEGSGGEVTMLPVYDAYPFSPACWPETKIKVLEAENADLKRELEKGGDRVYAPDGRTWQAFAYEEAAKRGPLQDEIARLREALAFYSDEQNYRLNGPLDPNSSWFEGTDRARAALAPPSR